MPRTAAEPLATVRAVLTLALVGVASLLTAHLLAPTMSEQSVLVLAALTTAATAALGSRHLVVLPSPDAHLLPARWADDVLPRLAGHSTDVDHHPRRPRAPGRV